jgi:hypothetical protein
MTAWRAGQRCSGRVAVAARPLRWPGPGPGRRPWRWGRRPEVAGSRCGGRRPRGARTTCRARPGGLTGAPGEVGRSGSKGRPRGAAESLPVCAGQDCCLDLPSCGAAARVWLTLVQQAGVAVVDHGWAPIGQESSLQLLHCVFENAQRAGPRLWHRTDKHKLHLKVWYNRKCI